jgi:hypothetical protein
MTKFAKSLALTVFLVIALSLASFGQTALTQTTLSLSQGVGEAGLASGLSSSYSTTVSLASATGITVAFNGQPVTFLYIDQEVEGILTTVTGQTTIFNVLRGQMGTKASPHASGDMVLAQIVTPQFGGGAGSGGLQLTDPPFNGACLGSGTVFTPWINVNTQAQWLCSTITGTWVPGFSNPYVGGLERVTTAVASAAGLITPSGPLFHITGALAITGFNIPIGFNATAVGGGQFCAIPDGTFTTTNANNIALGSTAVVNKMLCWSWDATNSKFVPTY